MNKMGLFALVAICGVVLTGWGGCRKNSCDCCKPCEKKEVCCKGETVIAPAEAREITERTSGTDDLK